MNMVKLLREEKLVCHVVGYVYIEALLVGIKSLYITLKQPTNKTFTFLSRLRVHVQRSQYYKFILVD